MRQIICLLFAFLSLTAFAAKPQDPVTPFAEAHANVTSGTGLLSVNFSARGSFDPDNGPLTYSLDFGDTATDAGLEVAHVYSAGFHVAVLTVTDAQGLFDVTSIEIRVAEDFLPLVNNIAAFPGFGPAPLSVQFTTDAFGGNDTQYLWDFGDGETSTLKEPSHTFVYVGEFTVRQIITDENGDIDQTDMQITVNP